MWVCGKIDVFVFGGEWEKWIVLAFPLIYVSI